MIFFCIILFNYGLCFCQLIQAVVRATQVEVCSLGGVVKKLLKHSHVEFIWHLKVVSRTHCLWKFCRIFNFWGSINLQTDELLILFTNAIFWYSNLLKFECTRIIIWIICSNYYLMCMCSVSTFQNVKRYLAYKVVQAITRVKMCNSLFTQHLKK